MYSRICEQRNERRQRSVRFSWHTVCILIAVVLVLFCAGPSPGCEAAVFRRRSSNGRKSDGEYDRSITTFSEDGRLLQVEYGIKASERGSTILAAVFHADDDDDDVKSEESGNVLILVLPHPSFGKLHRIDHHSWLMTAGLSGDARFLATRLREMSQNQLTSYGETCTIRESARTAAMQQHLLTRTSGQRPLGCSALVVGIDPLTKAPKIFATDPGGVCQEFFGFAAAGKDRTATMKEISKIEESLFPADNKSSTKETNSRAMKVAAQLASKMLTMEKSNGKQSEIGVDIWMIRSDSKSRGGMKTTCFRNIDKSSLNKLQEEQLK